MNRIDALQKKYPGIPRDVILQQDVVVQGVIDSDDLDKVSFWFPGRGSYESNDYDVTLQDIGRQAPWRVKPGYVLRPRSMAFKSGLLAGVRLRSTSPYAIREVSEGKFALFEGDGKVEEIFFPQPKPRTTPVPLTSRGTPISSLLELKRRCFCLHPVRYCEYFSFGEQCRFCNLNSSIEDGRSTGMSTPVTLNPDEVLEAYKIRVSEAGSLIEGLLNMGGFMDIEQEVRIFHSFVEKIASAEPRKPNLTLHMQAWDRKSLQRLRDAGLDAFTIQLEVMDPKMFPEICPGKAKHMPYEGWIECVHNAVDVYGAGNVAVKLVPGISLFAPSGHETWQEARDYHIEANRWCIKNGALPVFLAMWWAPGSALSQRDPSYVDKFPPTEYLLEVAQPHHEAMLEYGLYDKMNKFMYCALDCAGVYSANIGMLTTAGDVGNWMASAVPAEANWLAQFVSSVKSGARTGA